MAGEDNGPDEVVTGISGNALIVIVESDEHGILSI
jgi:hypothetical protein